MGKTWGQGSTRNSRKVRQDVLDRDRYECQLRLAGCTWTATEVHHRVGIALLEQRRADAQDPAELVAVCPSCHRAVTEKQRRVGQARMNAARKSRLRLPEKPHAGER